jgi:hypothetical protein
LSNNAGTGAGAGAAAGDFTNVQIPTATNKAPKAMLLIEVLSFIFYPSAVSFKDLCYGGIKARLFLDLGPMQL